MSSVSFTSPTSEVRLRGSERAHAAMLIKRLFIECLDIRDSPFEGGDDPLRRQLPPDCYLRSTSWEHFKDSFSAWLHGDAWLRVAGQQASVFDLQLNTAYAIGSASLRLLARIHGQCELHLWMEGENRAWVADIIQAGLECGLYRPASMGLAGWEEVEDFLRAGDHEPVVLSYSVCESFPAPSLCTQMDVWTPQLDDEDSLAFWDLPIEERWRLGMEALRLRDEPFDFGCELKPENFDNYFFGCSFNAFDVRCLGPEAAR